MKQLQLALGATVGIIVLLVIAAAVVGPILPWLVITLMFVVIGRLLVRS